MVVPSHAQGSSEATDDYLKSILELGGSEGLSVASNDLAARLGVKPASVTGMLQKLAGQHPPLVLYEKHRGVRLSAAGKRRAWEIVRHHRLLELFLHDVLKYSWDEVHEEAERLEHFISERFEDRVAAILGDPEIDPHGHIIPHRNGSLPRRDEVPLIDWSSKEPAVVSSISDRDPASLRELRSMGIVPGASVSVISRNANAALWLRVAQSRTRVRVSNELAACIALKAPVRKPARPAGAKQ